MKIKPGQISLSSNKPLLVNFEQGSWHIKTSYPDINSLAGTVLVFSPSGEVKELTFDAEGYVISEAVVKKGK